MPISKDGPSDDEVLANLTYPEFDEVEFQRDVVKEGLPSALALLPEHMRKVFVARAVEGASYARLAARFHDTEANVRLQYSRARKQLQGLLKVVDN